jgi:dTDP-4-dehydrorhamnose 3,5-epimerase
VTSNTAVFFYKCDNFYSKESEAGVLYNDKTINIDWNFATENLIISEKDKIQPTLENATKVW